MAQMNIKKKETVEKEVEQEILKQEYMESLPSVEERLESMSFAIQRLVRVDELDEGELAEMISLYPTWESAMYKGKEVEKGIKYTYKGKLYSVVQPHTPQDNWNPERDNGTLWDEVVPAGVVDEWEQRYGHNPYQPGDKITWQGNIYEAKEVTTYNPATVPNHWLKK